MMNSITLHIVTGFLGAGKTTFVQAMLAELARRNEACDKPERVVYVVNEFGEIGLDATIMSNSNVPSYELSNGCICCSLKSEFSLTLRRIIEDHQPNRIIFEPSGLFILSEMLLALSGEDFSNLLNIGGIITIIDSKNVRIHQAGAMSTIIKNQALLADILVASKMPTEHSASLDKAIDLQLAFANVPIITRNAWEFTPDDWQKVFDRPPRSLDQIRQRTTRRMVRRRLLATRQHPTLTSITIPIDTDTMSREDIEAAVTMLVSDSSSTGHYSVGHNSDDLTADVNSTHFGNIIRAKGVFSFRASRGISWLIQIVEKQIEWRKIPPRQQDEPSLLIIIGTDLKEDMIRQLFSN